MFFRRPPFTAALLLLLLCLSVLMPTGCAPKLPAEPAWEKDAGALLDQAYALFSKKQYDQSLKVVEVFFTRFPASRHRDRALYLQGEVRLIRREYAPALSFFKEVIEKFPASPLIFQSRYKLGLCYFELKEYDLAIANLSDWSKITDPAQLRRAAEMLAAAYASKKNYPLAVNELVALAETAVSEQRAGYRDRIREFIDKNLTEDELKALGSGTAYPADYALLRLAALHIEQRRYRDAIESSKNFLDRFPNHPKKPAVKCF